MTDFMVQQTCGPIATLASSDKGSLGNRLEATGAQMKNSLSTAAKDVLVLSGATAAGYGMVKCPKFAKFAAQIADKALNVIKKFGKPLCDKIKPLIAKIPPHAFKGIGLIAAITLPILAYIGRSHDYKSGQIDQKYTDKAAMQKTL